MTMKRNLLLIAGVFITVIVMMLLGNVITIAEKLGEVCGTVYVEYAFYVLVLVLAVIFVIGPIIRVHSAPEFPALKVDGTADLQKLNGFGKRLASACGYIEDEELRKKHQAEFSEALMNSSDDLELLKSVLDKELTLRFEGDKSLGVSGINSRMKEWAKSVFLITAVSQNSIVDSVVVLVLNYRQMEDLILSTGFRPTRGQLFRLYVNILSTTLISYCTSEIVNDLAGESSIAGALAGLKIPGVVTESAIQGAVNALLTLRIGYVTKAFLTEGPDALTGRQRRKAVSIAAFKSAFVAIPGVLAGTVAKTMTAMGKGLSSLMKGKSAAEEQI